MGDGTDEWQIRRKLYRECGSILFAALPFCIYVSERKPADEMHGVPVSIFYRYSDQCNPDADLCNGQKDSGW